MLEFCSTHSGSIRMLFPGGDSATIQSSSYSQEEWNEMGERGRRDGQMVFIQICQFPFILFRLVPLHRCSFACLLLRAPGNLGSLSGQRRCSGQLTVQCFSITNSFFTRRSRTHEDVIQLLSGESLLCCKMGTCSAFYFHFGEMIDGHSPSCSWHDISANFCIQMSKKEKKEASLLLGLLSNWLKAERA